MQAARYPSEFRADEQISGVPAMEVILQVNTRRSCNHDQDVAVAHGLTLSNCSPQSPSLGKLSYIL